MDKLILFPKNLNQRSLTPTWPLTPCLLRSHVWLYPRIVVSKSHDNTSMYVDTVINFANYHIHTRTTYILHTYILHTTYRMSDHIVSYWTQFRRDKNIFSTIRDKFVVTSMQVDLLSMCTCGRASLLHACCACSVRLSLHASLNTVSYVICVDIPANLKNVQNNGTC